MPNPMVASNWGKLLEPGLRSVFYVQNDAIVKESPVPILFNVQGSQKAVEHTYGIGGVGDVLPYTGRIEYDAFDPNYGTDFPHVEYTLGTSIERKLFVDDLYNVMNTKVGKLGTSFARTREKNAASIFSNAFSATDTTGLYPADKKPVGADGLALCSASHPLGPSNATTQSNLLTLPLTYDNLIYARRQMRLWKDDRGQLITVMPDTLIVTPALEDIAWSIINTVQKPGTANNDASFVYGQRLVKNLIVWDYIAGGTGNQWFYADSTLAKNHLWWFQREALDFQMDPTSDFNLVNRYRGYERYAYGFDYPFWVMGSNV